jgi:hypothetical protein
MVVGERYDRLTDGDTVLIEPSVIAKRVREHLHQPLAVVVISGPHAIMH